jgi:long-chain fatty acid transport protein
MKTLALAILATATTAHAGGLARPNGISARGVGMGGAWTAWVDDATAVWFNPAAMSEIEPQMQLGGELVIGPRTFTPVADDGTRGPDEKATVVAPVPALGVVGRFEYDDVPSRFTLGAGVWNTYGGKVEFPKTGASALDSVEDALVEVNAGAALRISDRLSIGGSLRFGIGLFALSATMMPFDAKLSASGVGVGMAWSALVRPTPAVRIALAWRSPMKITTSGSGTVTFDAGPDQESVEHEQVWPQQGSLGIGWAPAPRLRLAGQVDWTQWSALHQLVVAFPATPSLDQIFREDWRDSWTLRAGADYALTPAIAVRGGAYVDTAAVPDRTIERQYLDSLKVGVAAGGSVGRGPWRIDAGIDCILPNTRTVPNNGAEVGAFPADRNKAPGDYTGTLVTFELAGAYRF